MANWGAIAAAAYLCCDQQTIPFSIDNVEQIPTYDSIIYLYGGCPPFRWECSDPRARFMTEWTEVRRNTLIYEDLDDVIAIEYQVTDHCGTIVEGHVYEPYVATPFYNMVGWGYNLYSELGIGYPSGEVSTPQPLPGGKFQWAIPGGFGKREDGSCWFWGRNFYGRLGTGLATTIRYDAHQALASPVFGVGIDKVMMSLEYDYSIMMLDGGYAYSTGRNSLHGNLALGDYADRNGWTEIYYPGDPSIPRVWGDISILGAGSTNFITNGGDLWVAGRNEWYNFHLYPMWHWRSHENLDGDSYTVSVPSPSGVGGQNARCIISTGKASFYGSGTRNLFCVGKNGTGTLPHFSGNADYKEAYVDITPEVGGINYETKIQRTTWTVNFLGRNGKLWIGGLNNPGYMFATPHPQDTNRVEFAQSTASLEWIDMACGPNFVFLKKLDGTWWGFGAASTKLIGTAGNVYEPTYLPALDGMDKIWVNNNSIIGGYLA